jgi:hypothetical protein
MIRTFFTPQQDSFVFPVPAEYIGQELEIIVRPKKAVTSPQSLTDKKASFNAVSIDTRQYPFNREEANAR